MARMISQQEIAAKRNRTREAKERAALERLGLNPEQVAKVLEAIASQRMTNELVSAFNGISRAVGSRLYDAEPALKDVTRATQKQVHEAVGILRPYIAQALKDGRL